MVEHLRNMKELCRALHSDKDDRDMIVLRELLEWVLEQIIRLPAQERDLDLKGKILNDLYLLLERCEKWFFVKYSRHHAFSFFRLQRKPLKFSTSQSFAYQFEKTPPLLSISFEQIRVDRVRELLEALREDLQQLRPPPWAITLHRKVVEDLNIILGRPLFYPSPVRWTGSASGEHKALQSEAQFDVTQWLNTYDFDVWKKCNTKRVHLPSQTLLLNELSHLTSSCVFLLRHCEKMVQVRPPKNKHWFASHCLRTGILCTRANGRLSGLPNASLTLGSHAWNRRLNRYPEGNHTYRSLVQWFRILFRHRLSQ